MNLDIQTGVLTATLLLLAAFLLATLVGINSIQSGRKLLYFRKRRVLILRGWRLILLAVILLGFAVITQRFAAPLAYRVFPPSPTVTLTPTITETLTITLTPTVSDTPTITNTPSITDTPSMPIAIETQFQSTITPNAGVVFSKLNFGTKLDEKTYQPLDPGIEFSNPIPRMFAVFSYDKMTVGAQWSALWYLGDELVCYETLPWNGGTGGFGYSECDAPVNGWRPGVYEVRLFLGTQWVQSGQFTVKGSPPSPTATLTPTRTLTPSPTIGPSPTPSPSFTPVPSLTYTPSMTPTITLTPTETRTRRPTDTRMPTPTSPPAQ